jgi:hypothetical protein
MSRLPKADEANIFPGFLNTVSSGSFRKPVHVAFISFWKPLRAGTSGFQNSVQPVEFPLSVNIIKISNNFHRSAKEKFDYF